MFSHRSLYTHTNAKVCEATALMEECLWHRGDMVQLLAHFNEIMPPPTLSREHGNPADKVHTFDFLPLISHLYALCIVAACGNNGAILTGCPLGWSNQECVPESSVFHAILCVPD